MEGPPLPTDVIDVRRSVCTEMLSALPPCSATLLLGLAVGFGRRADVADNTQ